MLLITGLGLRLGFRFIDIQQHHYLSSLMKKLLPIILFCILADTLHGQSRSLGLGFNLGFKSIYQEGGFVLYSRFHKQLDLHFGYSASRVNGKGISTGIRFAFFDANYQPFIGAAFSRNYGNEFFYISQNDSLRVKVRANNFFYGEIGINRRMNLYKEPADSKAQNVMLISLNFSYRYTPVKTKLAYVDGNADLLNDKYFNTRVGSGFGGSITVVVLMDMSKDIKSESN
jgi:hypothetical protein